jgi:hypothetical protein
MLHLDGIYPAWILESLNFVGNILLRLFSEYHIHFMDTKQEWQSADTVTRVKQKPD